MTSLNTTDSYLEGALGISLSADRDEKNPESLTAFAMRSDSQLVSPWFMALAITLASVAFGVSVYLAWVGLTSSKVAGCDGGVFDCSHVLTSRWSVVAGIPVSIPAAGLYSGVLVSLYFIRSHEFATRRFARASLAILSMAAAFTALWFIALQVLTVGKLCPYCLTVHACGITLAGLVIRQHRLTSRQLLQFTAISATLVGGLIAIQTLSEAPQSFVIETGTPSTSETSEAPELFEPPELLDAPIKEIPAEPISAILQGAPFSLLTMLAAPQQETEASQSSEAKPVRTVPVNNGRKQLDVTKWPMWGNANAKNVVVEMFDYTCSHCRNTHQSIRAAATELGGDLAVITLPVPLSRACNDTVTTENPERADACEIAKLAIAVWIVDRTKFSEFHDWLFEQSRTAAEARQHAETLVDRDGLAKAMSSAVPGQYIERNVLLYKDAGSGTLPKTSFPTTTVVGEVGSGSTLSGMVRQYLGTSATKQ